MKITIDNIDFMTISETQKKVIDESLNEDLDISIDDDIKRRIKWIVDHVYEEKFKRLKNVWDKKLAENGVTMLPVDKEEYAQLVFSQPNFISRAERIASKRSEG